MGRAGRLVFLDLRMGGSEVLCEFDRILPSRTARGQGPPLFISWNATTCPPGADEIGEGAAFVLRPPGYEWHRDIHGKPDTQAVAAADARRGVRRFSWAEDSDSDVMMIFLLPAGYKLSSCSADQAEPLPWVSKSTEKRRLALYWKLDGRRARVSCSIEPATAKEIAACSASLNSELAKRDPHVQLHGIELEPSLSPVRELSLARPKSPLIVLGVFFTVLFLVIVGALLVAARLLPWYSFPLVVIGSILAFAVVVGFVLMQDESLSQKSFLELMKMSFDRLPLLSQGPKD
jgi:hypothetical protein